MARRKVSPRESVYRGARWQTFYPDVYTRTTRPWQTRTGRRGREYTSFTNLLGLNTSFDDLHRNDGESPYLRNVRYMGDKQTEQRAQVTSRNGAKLLGDVIGVKKIPAYDSEYFIELYEGKAVEIDLEQSDGLLVGGAIELMNVDGATGRLRIFLKETSASRPVCDANIDLSSVPRLSYVKRSFRFINPIADKGVVLRFEIDGDVDDAGNSLGRKVYLRASGRKGHRDARYNLPNTNKCLRETSYEWNDEPSTVCFERHVASGTPMMKGVIVHAEGTKHLVFPLKRADSIELWRFNLETKQASIIDTSAAPVDPRATAVRFALGLGKLYFVDGYSYLQRIDLATWKSEIAIAKQSDIDEEGVTPEDMQARKGASLIIRIKNRFYLSGFADDPNFVQYSILNSVTGTAEAPADNAGVQYDQYSDISWFYAPDRARQDSALTPVTALANYNGNLLVFRTNGASIRTTGSEFEAASMEDLYSYNIGVERQEDVCNLNGSLYIYNRSEGLRRFSGDSSTFQSISIDNELRRLPADSPRFLFGHANKLRFYCDLEGRGHADHNLLYYTILANSSPWYCDDNTPVAWVVGDQNDDTIYAMHALYPAIYQVDAPDQYTDFDSSITMEYHTSYRTANNLAGLTILRRVILRIVAQASNAWYVGVDFDHKDKPAVWRKYVKQQVDDAAPVESVFGTTEPAGTVGMNLMMHATCHDFQVRVLVSCWRDNAMLQYIEAQVGTKGAL